MTTTSMNQINTKDGLYQNYINSPSFEDDIHTFSLKPINISSKVFHKENIIINFNPIKLFNQTSISQSQNRCLSNINNFDLKSNDQYQRLDLGHLGTVCQKSKSKSKSKSKNKNQNKDENQLEKEINKKEVLNNDQCFHQAYNSSQSKQKITRLKCHHESPNKTVLIFPTLPKYNFDKDSSTQAFISQAESYVSSVISHSQGNSSQRSYLQQFPNGSQNSLIINKNKFINQNQNQTEKTMILQPKPAYNYCSICKETYYDYLKHIQHKVHKKNLKSSAFNQEIEALINHFQMKYSRKGNLLKNLYSYKYNDSINNVNLKSNSSSSSLQFFQLSQNYVKNSYIKNSNQVSQNQKKNRDLEDNESKKRSIDSLFSDIKSFQFKKPTKRRIIQDENLNIISQKVKVPLASIQDQAQSSQKQDEASAKYSIVISRHSSSSFDHLDLHEKLQLFNKNKNSSIDSTLDQNQNIKFKSEAIFIEQIQQQQQIDKQNQKSQEILSSIREQMSQ